MDLLTALATCVIAIATSPAAAIEAPSGVQVRLVRNPDSARSELALSNLVLIDIESLSFGPGDPPGTLSVGISCQYDSTAPDAIIENFSAREGPVLSASALGFGNLDEHSDFPPVLSEFFSRYPHIEYAVYWFTTGSGPASYSQNISAPFVHLGREGRCANASTLSLSQSITGSPNLTDGVAGVDLLGVVTQNELCLYVNTDFPFGHAFVSLQETKEQASFHGFYPMTKLDVAACDTGRFNDDSMQPWDHRICWLVTTDQFNAASRFVAQSRASIPTYMLWEGQFDENKDNCTSWAADVLRATGLGVPNVLDSHSIAAPSALDATLSSLLSSGSLFVDCGLVEANSNPAPPTPDRGEGPIDLDPSGISVAVLDDPGELGNQLGLPVVDQSLPTVVLSTLGELTLVFQSPPKQAVVNVVDWGDGSGTDLILDGQSASHVYSSLNSAHVAVGVLEDGSVQRYRFVVEFVSSGVPTATQFVPIKDYKAFSEENGPFVDPGDPPVIDVFSCFTDCNSNGVPDCEEGEAPLTLDCNGNGILDACDIATGQSADVNLDGIPDECAGQCAADFAEPFGELDFSDVFAFLIAFSDHDASADLADPTGVFDFSDALAFLQAFGAGCP